jgi:hypothetical protein
MARKPRHIREPRYIRRLGNKQRCASCRGLRKYICQVERPNGAREEICIYCFITTARGAPRDYRPDEPHCDWCEEYIDETQLLFVQRYQNWVCDDCRAGDE